MADFWQNEGGTSHAGKSRKLSRYNGFETEIQIVSGSSKGNSKALLFEGDGFTSIYTDYKDLIAEGCRYLDRTTGIVYISTYVGNDVHFGPYITGVKIPVQDCAGTPLGNLIS